MGHQEFPRARDGRPADADDVAGVEVPEEVAADFLQRLRPHVDDRGGSSSGTSTRRMSRREPLLDPVSSTSSGRHGLSSSRGVPPRVRQRSALPPPGRRCRRTAGTDPAHPGEGPRHLPVEVPCAVADGHRIGRAYPQSQGSSFLRTAPPAREEQGGQGEGNEQRRGRRGGREERPFLRPAESAPAGPALDRQKLARSLPQSPRARPQRGADRLQDRSGEEASRQAERERGQDELRRHHGGRHLRPPAAAPRRSTTEAPRREEAHAEELHEGGQGQDTGQDGDGAADGQVGGAGSSQDARDVEAPLAREAVDEGDARRWRRRRRAR